MESVLLGRFGRAGSIDAQSINSSFNHPQGIAIDSLGNIFVADTQNHNIKRLTLQEM